MKHNILTTASIALFMMLSASLVNTTSAQPRVGVSITYQDFYDELDPYGRWMDNPDYGYVWVPDCGPDFRPYSTNGHWVWSDEYDWIWVSDYDWGWAPFHYGRWFYDPFYGWMWVPGYEWSPAWVAWRDGGDYYGWAPLRPGINISINFSIGGYNPPIDYWCFAPRRYITSPRIYDYCVPRRNNITIINHTTIINNYNYNRNIYRTGPGRRDVERYTGRIRSVRFRESSRPGRTGFRNNEVSFYRPNVQHNDGRSQAPRRIEKYDRNNRDRGITRRNDNNNPGRDRNFGNNDGRTRNENGIPRRRSTFNRNEDRTPRTTERKNNRFEKPRNNDRQPRQNNRIERRNENRPEPGTRSRGGFEQRNTERQPDRNVQRSPERRTDPGRNNNNFPRRETRTEARPQRQSAPRMEQGRQQQQPRQFERRSSGGNNNSSGKSNRGGSGRRDR